MPGFTTHYLFGLDAYQHMDNFPLKQLIKKNHAAYSFGLQGPDLFFYYLPSYIMRKENIGSIAHTQRADKFLHHLLDSRKLFSEKAEQQIVKAYIAGFLGHYILDTHCHPYVYHKSNFKESDSRYHGEHMMLETDIDKELLQFYKHCLPSSFRQASTILLTNSQVRTIAAILYYVYKKTFPELNISYGTMRLSIYSMQLGVTFLRDVSGRKKTFIKRLEEIFMGYPFVSALIPSDTLSFYDDPLNTLHSQWQNPWKHSSVSSDSFLDLMDKAQENYLKTLNRLNLLFNAGLHTPEESERTKELLKMLGNKSYHSGLNMPSD